MTDHSPFEHVESVDPVESRRLFVAGSGAVVAGCLFAAWHSSIENPLLLFSAIAIIVLGAAPALLWARRARPWFPCFEISMLICIVFYAVPLLTLSDGLRLYDDDTLETAALLVIAYMASAIVAFNSVRHTRPPPLWASGKLLPDNYRRYLPAGLLVNTLYLCLDRFTTLIPAEFQGTVRAVCFGLGIITLFILACEWGRGSLSRGLKTLFSVCLTLQVIVLFSHLYLINGISLLMLAAIGYTTTRRRLPLIPIIALLPLIAVLHNGKGDMRAIYWKGDFALPSMSAVPSFFFDWITFGLQKKEKDESANLAFKLADRASLIQMIALSVDQVPSMRPHLSGESYIDIPAQVVPRFLWPDKPSSLMSNVRLAVYFNLIDPDNPFTTSIAFGIISEAYVNFGIAGVFLIGALTGFGFKHVALRSAGHSLFSPIGIFAILLTAWSFQAEQVLATWLTSLFQASAVSIIAPLAWKKFFGGT